MRDDNEKMHSRFGYLLLGVSKREYMITTQSVKKPLAVKVEEEIKQRAKIMEENQTVKK